MAGRLHERAEFLPRVRVVGMNLPVTEVANQQGVTEITEVRGGFHHPPWGIEIAAADETPVEVTVGLEHADEPVPATGDIVLRVCVLLGVADVEFPVDERNVKWGVSL